MVRLVLNFDLSNCLKLYKYAISSILIVRSRDVEDVVPYSLSIVYSLTVERFLIDLFVGDDVLDVPYTMVL